MKRLTKVLLGCLLSAIVLSMTACTTVKPPISASSNAISNPAIGFENLSRDQYELLGKITGIGEVSYNSATNIYDGDTLKYGNFGGYTNYGSMTTSVVNLYGFIPTYSTTVSSPNGAPNKAYANASYNLIQKAKDLNADAIVFITSTTETTGSGSVTTSKVTISGIAVKIK